VDFIPQEMRFLLDLAIDLKKAKYAGTEQQKLKEEHRADLRKGIHTHTLCFETAAYDRAPTLLTSSEGSISGKKNDEGYGPCSRRMYDGIEYRASGRR